MRVRPRNVNAPSDPDDPNSTPWCATRRRNPSFVFRDRHDPSIPAGPHKLTATLTVSVDDSVEVCKTNEIEFLVGCARFSLAPSDIHSAYPPRGSRGNHDTSLPHLALCRDTIPWERKGNSEGGPWLALILLNAEESARHPLETITLDEYRARIGGTLHLEHGQSGTDYVQVVKIDKRLLPSSDELAALCHVRRTFDGDVLEESTAVVVCRRLPFEGRNTVHLVSVEARYPAILNGEDEVTVVSLESWSFTSESQPFVEDPTQERKVNPQTLDHLLKNMTHGWLRIPADERTTSVEAHLARGQVPLPHRFRTGESGVSWYAGPLVANVPRNPEVINLPARTADALLTYHESLGMLDISYAAAWELGRLLALEHREVEIALAAWRRQVVLQERLKEKQRKSTYDQLPSVQRALGRELAPPSKVLVEWIRSLRKLEGIPFKYLVPDERMLPPESIRFFRVNRPWMDALFDGVLSLTRPAKGAPDPARRQAESRLLAATLDRTEEPQEISGFLMRSAVVSGWPGLEITAARAEVYHQWQFSPSIKMVLFTGQPRRVILKQNAGTLHLVADLARKNLWSDESLRLLKIEPGVTSSQLANDLLSRTESLEIDVTWH